jgi:cold-inducible RNA-binding protein
MSKKLFVGGLSWGTTDDGLHSAFSKFGEIVEAKVITDRETGRSRGFGFVTFAADESAASAIAEMNGTELDGRSIKVNEAEDKGPRGGGGGGGGGRGGRGGGRGQW